MTNSNPTFSPGDEAWHVRHGKVNLEHGGHKDYPLATYTEEAGLINLTRDGKLHAGDKGRVLYTLSEAERYGWYKPEPLRVEFDGIVRTCAGIVQVGQCGPMGETFGDMLRQFDDKRVRITVEEVVE